MTAKRNNRNGIWVNLSIAIAVAILSLSASAQTLPIQERVHDLENHANNEDHYNTTFDNTIHDDISTSEKRTDTELAAILKTQGEYETRIISLEHLSIWITSVGGSIIVVCGMLSPFVVSSMNRRYKKADDLIVSNDVASKLIDDRLDLLERSEERVTAQMRLVTDFGNLVTRSFSSDLHHPMGHNRADELLTKLDAGELTAAEQKEFAAAMHRRENDSTVTLQEQNKARELPKLMKIVEQLNALSENPQGPTPAKDRNKVEVKGAAKVEPHG